VPVLLALVGLRLASRAGRRPAAIRRAPFPVVVVAAAATTAALLLLGLR